MKNIIRKILKEESLKQTLKDQIKEFGWKDAAELVIDIVGHGELELLDRDLSFPKRGRLSIDKARFDLGYNPTINFEQGIKQYYDWYQQNPVLWRGSSVH